MKENGERTENASRIKNFLRMLFCGLVRPRRLDLVIKRAEVLGFSVSEIIEMSDEKIWTKAVENFEEELSKN